jgi:hypothetical protein
VDHLRNQDRQPSPDAIHSGKHACRTVRDVPIENSGTKRSSDVEIEEGGLAATTSNTSAQYEVEQAYAKQKHRL